MSTAILKAPGTFDLNEAALTMALAVLAERIRQLPKVDKADLREISKLMFTAENLEEELAAKNAFLEIVEQTRGRIIPFAVEEAPDQLRNWTEFVSRQIKTARTEAGMTQAELEAATGLPQSHISRLENQLHSPSSSTLEKIAQATSKPLKFFVPQQPGYRA